MYEWAGIGRLPAAQEESSSRGPIRRRQSLAWFLLRGNSGGGGGGPRRAVVLAGWTGGRGSGMGGGGWDGPLMRGGDDVGEAGTNPSVVAHHQVVGARPAVTRPGRGDGSELRVGAGCGGPGR